MYIVRSWTVLVHVHCHMYRTVPFSVFTATVLVGPSPVGQMCFEHNTKFPCSWDNMTWNTFDLHVVQACIIVNVLLVHQNCCWDLEYHMHHDCLQAKSILMHWYSSIKLAVYTFLLHSIYLHALHITSYLINFMFISCYHLSSCTHNTLYILTLQ